MSTVDQILADVQEFCPIPPGSRTADSPQAARAILLAPEYTTLRDMTSTDLYRDDSLDLNTRLASFFNAWPMFSEGAQHHVLRQLTRQIVATATEDVLTQVDQVLALTLPVRTEDVSGTQPSFDWVADVAVPVSAAVVTGLIRRFLPSASPGEVVALGGALMLKLSGRNPGVDRERAALAAGVRLATLVDQHRGEVDAGLCAAGISSELVAGALAQVITGALDPLQAVVAAVPLLPGVSARAVIARVAPFRFVRRIDLTAGHREGVRIPLAWSEPDGIPFGLGPHRCTAAVLTEEVVDRVIRRINDVAPNGIEISDGSLIPAAFLQFGELWATYR